MKKVNRKMFQVVPNPDRHKIFKLIEEITEAQNVWPEEQAKELRQMGILIDDIEITTSFYREFKSIGYCKDKTLAKFVKADVLFVTDMEMAI